MKTALYRHFDAAGRLLYVGISNDTLRRLCQHKDRSHWFHSISRVDVQWLDSRELALAAEAMAIRTEKPEHNIKRPRVRRVPPVAAKPPAEESSVPVARRDPAAHPLVGMFFHTFVDGEMEYQGHVTAVDGETVIAQMFSWLTGYPTNLQAFQKTTLYSPDCKLYPSIDVWRGAADRQQSSRRWGRAA